MNATQKKALRKKLSTLAKERWARKRKEKGKKKGTWKAERTKTDGVMLTFHPEEEVENLRPRGMVHGELPTRWFTIDDVQEVKALSNRLGNETFLKLVGMFG